MLKKLDRSELESTVAGVPLEPRFARPYLESFKEVGFAVVPNIISLDLIKEANEACSMLDHLVAFDTSSRGDFNLEAPDGGWFFQHGSDECYRGVLRKVSNLLDHGNAFVRLASDHRLLSFVAGFLGSTFSFHSKGFLMIKPPDVSSPKPWHQDSAYFSSGHQILTAWIPLRDVKDADGCLRIIPGSHVQGAVNHIGPELHLELDAADERRTTILEMASGSVAFIDQHTVHASPINRSAETRRAVLLRYQTEQ